MKRKIKQFLLVYVVLWSLSFVVVVLMLSRGERKFTDSAKFFLEMASTQDFLIGFHFLFLLCYLLFIAVQYFKKLYKKEGKHIFIKQFCYRFALPLLIAFVGFKTLIYANSYEWNDFNRDSSVMNTSGEINNLYRQDKKHRGISVFGWSEDNTDAINQLIKANVEWVAVIPFLYQKDEKTKQVNIPEYPERYTRRDSNFIRAINDLHKRGIRVQLKPHLWMSNGWRSNIVLGTNEEWDIWFDSYRTNMLRYAKIASQTKTELFCIGTELRTSVKKQPERWDKLIDEIKEIYTGELTYAANWYDEYEHVTFWNKLDYIGIQAYFPLTATENPDLKTIEKGWDKPLKELKALHDEYNKPVLFTEVGYKSESKATIKPWEWASYTAILTEKKSDRTQQLAYEALFKEVWGEPWFAGLYIWQWDTRTSRKSAKIDLDFSPRFKPAENVMAKWFGK